jgi:glutathione S-transferase
MEATVIVTIIALLQYSYFGVLVGASRGKYDVPAPAQTGNEQFERMSRVHLNTLEQLIVFIPALWMHAQYANPVYGAILGVIFIVGRFIYRAEYLKDPDSRSLGFGMTFIPSVVLLIWTLVVVVLNLF